jgi:hypothetical protein
MYVLVYIAAAAAANLTVAHFGPASTPIVGFLLIGLDLAVRDRLHLNWHGRALWGRMLVLIAAAGGISYALNPESASVALASLAAFSVAAIASAVVFQAGRRYFSVDRIRHPLPDYRSAAVRSEGRGRSAVVVDRIPQCPRFPVQTRLTISKHRASR